MHEPPDPLTRRDFTTRLLAALGAAAAMFPAPPAAIAQEPTGAPAPSPAPPAHDMSMAPKDWTGHEQIALLVYPQCTALDVIGPQYMFGSLMGATVRLVAKTLEPITTDPKVRLLPDVTFADCPADLDILCVPGGTGGTLDAMADRATLDFLADRGSRAKLVSSVCTGSLLLGAAGLLRGYKATSHWVTRPLLARFGAEPVDARVVRDRNRLTGAGVTAGLDLGLTVLGELRNRGYAEAVQLIAEYDPQPPFDSGVPAKASAANRAMMDQMFAPFVARVEAAAQQSQR